MRKKTPKEWEQYEVRVQAYEDQGMTRSDAQGAVDAEEMTGKSRKLLVSKTCNVCKAEFDSVPATARWNEDGAFWECGCKSTMFSPVAKIDFAEYCDCADCEPSDPCQHDCDRDNECSGCRESREGREETEFEIDCAQGRRR